MLTLSGVIFCAGAAMGKAQALCVTEGCALYKDYSLFGISLWWVGCAAFSALLILALLKKRTLLYFAALLCAVGDLYFLAWMALSVPCINCLVAGGLFFLVLLTVTLTPPRLSPVRRKWGGVVIAAWLVLASPNLFAVGWELSGPWAMAAPAKTYEKIYFSPTCPVCVRLVNARLAEENPIAAYYPVPKSTEDIQRFQVMQEQMENGASFADAWQAALAPLSKEQKTAGVGWMLKWRLYRNRISVMRMGVNQLPVRVTVGMRRKKAAPPSSATPGGNQTSHKNATPRPGTISLPNDLGEMLAPLGDAGVNTGADQFESCSQNEGEDCEK